MSENNNVPRFELLITDDDKFGTNIAKMSDFYQISIAELTRTFSRDNDGNISYKLPIASVDVLTEAFNYGKSLIVGNTQMIPDYDSLPNDVKEKLQKGIYKLGESKQVEGNIRAVVVDETGTRVKDITFKEISSLPNATQAIHTISIQLQLQQLSQQLDDLQFGQMYQIQRGRDRDIFSPFFVARDYILKAQNETNESMRMEYLKIAQQKLSEAENNIYLEINTNANALAKQTNRPAIFRRSKLMDELIDYTAQDIYVLPKIIGLQTFISKYLGESEDNTMSYVLRYNNEMKKFIENPVTRKGLTTVQMIHMNCKYTEDSMDSWLNLKDGFDAYLEHSSDEKTTYIVSMEDVDNGTEKGLLEM